MMSISFFVLIMILTAEALIDVYTKKIVSIDRYTERFDPSGVTYNSAYHGFTIQVGITNQTIDPRYGKIKLEQVTTQVQDGVNTKSLQVLQFGQCGASNFIRKDNKDFMCTDSNSDFLLGCSYIGTTIKNLRITLLPCENKTDFGVACGSESEIRSYLQNKQFNYYFTNTYFDSESKYDRIKLFIADQGNFIKIEPTIAKDSELFISPLNFQETYLFKDITQKSYFVSDQIRSQVMLDSSLTLSQRYFARITIRLDTNKQVIHAKNYQITQLLADLGGISNSIVLVLSLVTQFFSRRIFMIDILNKLFMVKNQNLNKDKKLIEPCTTLNQQEQTNFSDLLKSLQEEKITSNEVNGIVKSIYETRVKFKKVFKTERKFKQMCMTALPNLTICCQKDKIALKNRKKIIQNGEKRFMQELDVVNLLKSVRLSKLLFNSILTQKQRILYQFQRAQLIESDKDPSESDYDGLKRDLFHGNAIFRVFALGKINKVLQTYTKESKISQLDRNLLMGYYVHRPIQQSQNYVALESNLKRIFTKTDKNNHQNTPSSPDLEGNLSIKNLSADTTKIQIKSGKSSQFSQSNQLSEEQDNLDFKNLVPYQRQHEKFNNSVDSNIKLTTIYKHQFQSEFPKDSDSLQSSNSE